MKLGDDVRAADAAVWRRADAGRPTGKARAVPPLLAVEIAGAEQVLRDKARWYLTHGTAIVWIVLPEQRELVVLRDDEECRYARNQRPPEAPELPGLAPSVCRFFAQLDEP